MDLFDLVATLSLDTSKYDENISGAEKKASTFGDKLGGAMKVGGAAVGALAAGTTALVGGMVKSTGETAKFGDNIDKMSQKMGISAQAYQEWDAILQHSGTSIDSMSRGMQTLQKNAVNSADKFEKLGITQEQLANMSTEELFSATITGLQGMEEGAERTALASELLGGSAKELGALLNTSAEDTEKMRQRVHELGGVMSDDAVSAAAAYQDSLQDMQTAFSGVTRSLTSEFMPGITTVMDGLAEIFSGDSENGLALISQGVNDLITNLTEQIPQFLEVGTGIVLAIGEAILDNLPALMEAGGEAILTIVSAIIENLPQIIETGLSVIVSLANGIAQSLPDLIPTIVDVVIQIVETLIDNVDMLIDSAIAIIIALANGLIASLPKLLEKAPEIVAKLVQAIITNAPKLLQSALQLIVSLAQGLIQNLPKIVQAAGQIVQSLINGVKSLMSRIISIGSDIVKGVWQGLQNMVGWFTDKVKGFFSGIVNGVKNLLGISSPSKVFAGIGKNMALGVGEGWDDEFSSIKNGIDGDLDFSAGSPSLAVSGSGGVGGYGAGGGINIQIENMTVRDQNDIREIARELNRMINQSARGIGVTGGVYA